VEHFTDRPRFDVICVGDVASDMSIALSPDQVELRYEDGRPKLVLPLGGKVTYEGGVSVALGGNAANVAVALTRLGLRVGLASYLGADQAGRDLLVALHGEGIDTSLVHLEEGSLTNVSFVLRLGQERTILVHHEHHRYHWAPVRPHDLPAWVFLSSVGSDAPDYEEQLADWLEATPSVQLLFAPGTHQIAQGMTRLARLYRRAALLVCNREEAAAISGRSPAADIETLLEGLLALGPRRVVITDGPAGADASDGSKLYSVPVFPDAEPVVDRTGAGDAFSAALLAYLMRGMAFDEALLRGPVNAMSVVHAVGTQTGLLRPDALDHYLERAPQDFVVVKRPLVPGGAEHPVTVAADPH
jgi:ribokinase